MSRLHRDHEVDRARTLASRYLRFGTRSTAQLRAYLTARDIPARLIGREIVECSRKGWLDDRACATLWATTLADRGYAWAAIHDQLLAKGFDAILIDRLLATQAAREPDDIRVRTTADGYVRRRARSGRSLRSGLARHLSSRGFDAELIDRVLTDSLGPPNDS